MSAAKSFMEGIAPGRREELACALKALWTHDSTAIEWQTTLEMVEEAKERNVP